ENRVVLAQNVPAVGRDHVAGLLVVRRVPGQTVPFQRRLVALDGGVQNADGLIDDFGTDAVAADDRDAESCHCTIPLVRLRAGWLSRRVVGERGWNNLAGAGSESRCPG